MGDWDDEDFEVPVAAVNSTWDDEEDEDVLESWEAAGDDEDEENNQSTTAPARKKIPVKAKILEREQKEREEREAAALKAPLIEDARAIKERTKAAELDSDLHNAATLFGDIALHPKDRLNQQAAPVNNGPTKLSEMAIFNPKTKVDFENLRKTLSPILVDLEKISNVNYANFVTDLARDLSKSLSMDQIRKVSSTLAAVSNEKQRDLRSNRGTKKKPLLKDASAKKDDNRDTTNYDDFGDDDFM